MSDLTIIHERLARSLAEAPAKMRGEAQDLLTADQVLAGLREDGTWADVDYSDRQRSHWSPAQHLRRILVIAQAARQADAGDEAPRLLAGARRALTYWLDLDPQSDNWWHNDIGTPLNMGHILVLLGDDVAPDDRARGIEILARVPISKTGQNRAWLATVSFLRALLTEDEPLARLAIDEILGEVRVVEGEEGIQPDWSFHQHGPQLYQGNYGAAFMETVAPYATLLAGTVLAMPEDQVETLSRMLLEGTRWMTWGDQMDYHVVGRFITSPYRSRWESRTLVAPCAHLAEVSPSLREALLAYHDALTGRCAPGAIGVSGNRHYWRSDIMVHRREGFYTSIRMASVRTVRSEQCNGEGLRNYHLGDGVTFFLQTGQEYDGIWPVVDWRRLPGVTCRQADEPLPILSTGRHRGATEFVGGASDGVDGLAAMEYALDGVAARKAWFCLGDRLVCLGAGIRSAGDPVRTGVEQCLLRGPVTVGRGGDAERLAPGETVAGGLAWAHHGGLGYLLLDGAGATVRAAEQTGSWREINSNLPADPVAEDVFSLWIDHGPAPAGAAYAYAVAFGLDAAGAATWAADPGFRVLANDEAVQAVASQGGDVVQVAYYRAGGLEVGEGLDLSVDTPCLVMLRRTAGGWSAWVAEPTQRATRLALSIGAATAEVALPTGGRAGETARVDLAG
jgi:chondroitin AC lyase